jgi:hypothetical protein
MIDRTTVIELVGLPGAGKTTFERSLAGRVPGYHRCRPTTLRVVPRWTARARGVLRHPLSLTSFVAALVRDSRQPSLKLAAIRWLVSTLEVYETPSRLRPVTVLSEGVAQRSILGFVDTNGRVDDARLQTYLNSVPLPDVLVSLDISLESCLERLVGGRHMDSSIQQRSRLDIGRPELRRFLTRAQTVIDYVVSELRECGVHVMQVDVEDSAALEDVLDLLGERIERQRFGI